jgi:radical SAM superfamily enzyme YgiQ (UPF0313 family)
MRTKTVVFIAFLEQDNLGVGYNAAVLLQNNIDIKILDFRLGKDKILGLIHDINPIVVGFSIIFQYHIYEFKKLIDCLRSGGVKCHFTAGGHYPSLRHEELITFIPELDSVVLFEGEYTLLNLVQSLWSYSEWKNINGIAYKKNGSIFQNELRALESNLDNFPPPVRQPLREYALGKKYATLLAGRGCYYNCSFCSIKEFYSKPPGAIKRLRNPKMVAREMELLHHELDCSIFIFQDDDFPVAGKKGKEWVRKFCSEIKKSGLGKKIMWKINCRTDEIDPELFTLMKSQGLFLVYLGIEAGTDEDLKFMNKHLTTTTNLEAVQILKDLKIRYDYGFMLFHPESTFESVHDNLNFLYTICADGSSPITMCKMLPYAETKVEKSLKANGRLIGKPGFENYHFKDQDLDDAYLYINKVFDLWINEHEGLLNISRWVRYYSAVYNKFYQPSYESAQLDCAINKCISESNKYFIDTAKKILDVFYTKAAQPLNSTDLAVIDIEVSEKHSKSINQLKKLMDGIKSNSSSLSTNQEAIFHQ